MTYRGYLNYYIGSSLKTYQFDEISAAMYYILVKITKMRASSYIGALVLQVVPGEIGSKTEVLTLVDQEFLLPTPDSQPTIVNKR